jgi:hypothetical protein
MLVSLHYYWQCLFFLLAPLFGRTTYTSRAKWKWSSLANKKKVALLQIILTIKLQFRLASGTVY